jgi:hypothetical protein
MAHGVIDVMKDVVNILLVFLLFNWNASSFLKDKKLTKVHMKGYRGNHLQPRRLLDRI